MFKLIASFALQIFVAAVALAVATVALTWPVDGYRGRNLS